MPRPSPLAPFRAIPTPPNRATLGGSWLYLLGGSEESVTCHDRPACDSVSDMPFLSRIPEIPETKPKLRNPSPPSQASMSLGTSLHQDGGHRRRLDFASSRSPRSSPHEQSSSSIPISMFRSGETDGVRVCPLPKVVFHGRREYRYVVNKLVV